MDRAHGKPGRACSTKATGEPGGKLGYHHGPGARGRLIKMPGMELKQTDSRKDKMEVGQRKYVSGSEMGFIKMKLADCHRPSMHI